VLALETALAGLTKSGVERRDVSGMYNPTDLAGLATLMPGFDWPTYVAAIGNPTPGTLSVTTPAYFQGAAGGAQGDQAGHLAGVPDVRVLDALALALPASASTPRPSRCKRR
jgi:predicted metalloendopeptidase